MKRKDTTEEESSESKIESDDESVVSPDSITAEKWYVSAEQGHCLFYGCSPSAGGFSRYVQASCQYSVGHGFFLPSRGSENEDESD